MTSATRSGRIGGLTVALGIGAAIAGNAGLAAADTDDPGPSRPASTSTASVKSAPDADASRVQRRTPRSGDAENRQERPRVPKLQPSPTKKRGSALNGPTPTGSAVNDAAAQPRSSTGSTRKVRVTTRPFTDALRAQAGDARPTGRPQAPASAVGVLSMLGSARRESVAAQPDAGGASAAQHSAAAPVPGAQPSPLATPDQLAAERRATQITATPVVGLAKVVLKVGWLLSAHTNFAQVGGPDTENLAQLNRSVDEYANQAAMEVQLLDPNNPKVLQQVMPPHTWYGQTAGGNRIWYDNPDTIYRFVAVNAASEYVITGRFDPDHMPADTNFSVLTGLNGDTASNLNGNELELDDQGNFRITVSSRPAGPGEDHLQLPPEATLITTRNTLSDWSDQTPMSVSIERVSGPPDSLFAQIGGFLIPGIGPAITQNPALVSLVSIIPPFKNPPLALQATETALLMVILGLTKQDEYIAVATTDPATGKPRNPNELSQPAHNAQFLSTQLQSAGYFQLDDDEALVLTIDPGSAGYFVVPITNDWTITGNYWDQQTSLNNAQAMANRDGTYTIVISPADPGVANWVSTGGLNQGTISVRFQGVDPDSPDQPTVSSQVVALDDLATALPAGTVYVTPAQRRAILAERKAGYDTRYAPYPQR